MFGLILLGGTLITGVAVKLTYKPIRNWFKGYNNEYIERTTSNILYIRRKFRKSRIVFENFDFANATPDQLDEYHTYLLDRLAKLHVVLGIEIVLENLFHVNVEIRSKRNDLMTILDHLSETDIYGYFEIMSNVIQYLTNKSNATRHKYKADIFIGEDGLRYTFEELKNGSVKRFCLGLNLDNATSPSFTNLLNSEVDQKQRLDELTKSLCEMDKKNNQTDNENITKSMPTPEIDIAENDNCNIDNKTSILENLDSSSDTSDSSLDSNIADSDSDSEDELPCVTNHPVNKATKAIISLIDELIIV
jgi:hypothetical protein